MQGLGLGISRVFKSWQEPCSRFVSFAPFLLLFEDEELHEPHAHSLGQHQRLLPAGPLLFGKLQALLLERHWRFLHSKLAQVRDVLPSAWRKCWVVCMPRAVLVSRQPTSRTRFFVLSIAGIIYTYTYILPVQHASCVSTAMAAQAAVP